MPLVQQHWNPRPPSPDQSLATTRRMYSPGSLNVAVVDARPVKTAVVEPGSVVLATAGVALEKVTVPGPRNLLHPSVTGGSAGGLAPGKVLQSSATQTVNGSGLPIVAVRSTVRGRGPFTAGPASSK